MVITSWDRHYPPGISWSDPLPPPVSLDFFLENAAAKWPHRTALDFYDRRFTFLELRDLAARAAKGFQVLGVKPGTHVGIHLPNMPQYIVCIFGVWMAGGTVVNFNPQAPTSEIEAQLADSETQILVSCDVASIYAQTTGLNSTILKDLIICSLDDFPPAPTVPGFSGPAIRRSNKGREIDFSYLIENDGTFVRHPLGDLCDEIAVLQYTGGTTGEPKAAMLTHANFSAAIHGYERWGWRDDPIGGSSLKRLSVAPLGHVYGLSSCLSSVATGAEFLTYLRVDAARILDDIERKKVVVITAVPSTYVALVEQSKTRSHDLSSLRYCIGGGAALAGETLERFKNLTGLTPMVGYGLTETTTAGGVHPMGGKTRPGAAGLPPPQTVVEITDLETGMTVLPAGQSGEVCIRGPQVMKGYWRRPEETASAFRGGRFHTGDIGFIDEHGYLTLIDRKKDVILCGGFNVFPRNIEEVIHRHHAISDVAVVGVPDETLGQHVKAFIVLRTGEKPITYADLRSFLRGKLSEYEIPMEMEIRDSLPSTAIGKVAKKDLLAELTAQQRPHLVSGDPVESRLISVWEEIFERKPIGIDESFFDLGGDSLLTARMFLQIEEVFGKNVPLASFLQVPTIKQLARILRENEPSISSAVPRVTGHLGPRLMRDTFLTGFKNRILQIAALYAPGAKGTRVWLHRLRGVNIGNDVFIGTAVIIETAYPKLVSIGNNVSISIRSVIIAHFRETVDKAESENYRSVVINDDVWIGPGAIILPNVTIGRGAVIGAGSVVKASVPPLTMVEGNPAVPVAHCGVPLSGNSYEQFIHNLKPIARA